MTKGINGKIAFLIIITLLISVISCSTVTVSAYNIGDSIVIYSNPKCTANKAGKSFIWALSPDATVESLNNGYSARAKFFKAGDGIIHEPIPGSLDGFNTTVTVTHKAGLTKIDGGTFVSRDSDLAAMVTYVENGIVKKSPAFRFTGFHYNAKQGSEFGPEGTITEFNLGTYPNVVSVNVFHILSEPLESSSLKVSNSTPFHENVRFDVAGPTGIAQLPAAGTYYIETKIKPSSELSVPMATPAPTPQVPTKSGKPMEPIITPNPIQNGPVVSLGLGTYFTLYPQDTTSIPAPVNGVIENAAPIMNGSNGITRYEIAPGGSVAYNVYFGMRLPLLKGAVGTKAIYIPKAGLLDGVVTDITAYQRYCYSNTAKGMDAIIKYDGGKEKTITYLPDSYTSPDGQLADHIDIGSFLNVESVTIVTKDTVSQYMPNIIFRVANENPSLPAPELPRKKYQKPNLSTVEPILKDPIPVPTVSTPICINEVVSSNITGYKDKNGNHNDWVELYNSSDLDVDISGYGLTDNLTSPNEWLFPNGSKVPAKGYLMIIASGLNTIVDGELHSNFSISKGGEKVMLSDTTGGVVSILDLPSMDDDVSLSRYPDGSNSLKLTKPTPNSTNRNAEVISSYIDKPHFSAESGFYKSSVDLTLSSQNGTIYYTLDGSTPTASSLKYTTPVPIVNRTQQPNVISAITYLSSTYIPKVNVDKSMIVRAIAIDGEGNKSEVVTKSYFINYDMAKDFNNTMVVSLTTDADNLFDPGYGIFPNYEEQHKEFEREVHLDMFDGTGKLVIDQQAGVRVRGFGYKDYPQKSLNIYARSEYGDSKFNYPLFDDAKSIVDGSPIKEYKSFALRNGSHSAGGLRFKDGLAQFLGGKTGVAYQSERPAVMFINGEYWGVYYMAERAEDDYVESYYDLPKEDIILIKNGLNKGDATEQDRQLYLADRTFLANTDFSIPENYDKLTQKFDLDNLIMYYAANINTLNGDWITYNFVTWRSRYITDKPYEDGKWRFLEYDLDAAYMKTPQAAFTLPWGEALLSNPSLKRILANAILDTYSNVYAPENAYNELKYWYDEYMPIFSPKMEQRWGPIFSVYNDATAIYGTMTSKESEHISILKSVFGLTRDLAYLNVRVNNPNFGTVKVNSITPDFTMGSYSIRNFTDYTSTLQAIPKKGYIFTGWTVSDGSSLTSDTDPTIYVTLSPNGTRVTANFERIMAETHYISTAEDLEWVAQMVNSDPNYANRNYILQNNIVLTGTNNYAPIGTLDHPFTGTFDGNNHTISGINLTSDNIQGRGLFGYVSASGVVKNVGAENVNIVSRGSDGKNVGGIVGNNAGLIENCYSTGSLSGVSTVGGIVGNNNNGGKVKNCFSVAIINCDSSTTKGGIAGKTETSASIINSYSLITPVCKNDGGLVDSLTSAKSAEAFVNGTVTYLLNANQTVTFWRQGVNTPEFVNNDTGSSIGYSDGVINVSGLKGLTNSIVVVASYEDNKLLDLSISTVVLDSNGNGTVFLRDNFSSGSDGKIKIMLLDSTESMSPICNSISVTK